MSKLLMFMSVGIALMACQETISKNPAEDKNQQTTKPKFKQALVTDIYTADPSAHVFNNKIYIYPSHDVETDIKPNHHGDHFAMRDYKVLSMDSINSEVITHPTALDINDIPWAGRQLWAPDAAEKNGQYYLYFPARDKQDIFRLGVAKSDKPEGPFVAEPNPMPGSYSIDPSVYKDSDNTYYLYFGGIWGGQLQNWQNGKFEAEFSYPADKEPALMPKVAKLAGNMLEMAEKPRDVMLLDESGEPITQGDNHRRFFEAAWVHKYKGTYYFSYSTGDTHKIAYATGSSPYGPFTYQGVVLEPVIGWTNHHSIMEYQGKWYLFYHDSSLSKGQTHLRSVKMAEIKYDAQGKIQAITDFVEN
ncbi:glycoside hydrolase family 43 protein [Catenovulum maritimum]|uniref:Alpha-N-arabinofuranosidase n=1 Tax=Catenovulum maritimum TaxID=1513271 RepID=A0A0J8JQN3_9ALTE|nr:glycoside hydrolase family 43 protein [Catenovulum maritimum]KMT67026.1 alpha-N-arabinofuranosidase [Catenovulum maritimum]